ncbi:MAG: hypothetical protein JXB48_05430 [Candidatus Latescibacteria bacterium]|nr:hypothetical protein [Candidatus Latescibacterota bacterium]
MSEIPVAKEITLRKMKPMAPPFHQHIAKNRLLGKTCRIGDSVIVYEVIDTLPQGIVTVTEKTLFHFE